ncbi:hypothetical protein FLONG3_11443 [Fusarium longipes]|uniref:Uncharacterized protein n=1 Tax=Fusarium longipes TaxID=694270 RepID=A0A395REI5_9HYPO|nr:hypothetical protein FLONG3_11443 [Fusarium longipes]
MPATPDRYKEFPSLDHPVLSRTPENRQILRNLKNMYDKHSKGWDVATRHSVIDFVLNGETEVTERIARSPHRHRFLQRNMTFAIWIVLRATYGLDKLTRLQHRFFKEFPGANPASFVSPLLARKTTSGPLHREEDEENEMPPPTRAPSIFGSIDVSTFAYNHPQSDPPKRKLLDAANYQPWKMLKRTVKREPDVASFETSLRPPAFPNVYVLPTEESRNGASPVNNTLLPSVESPDGLSDPEQNISLVQNDKENQAPSLDASYHEPTQVSNSAQPMESEKVSAHSPLSSSQIVPLVEQCRKFDVRIRELQTDISTMRKERQEERQSFIKTMASIRDEIRADMDRSRQSTVSTKIVQVGTVLTEYNNTIRNLHASLDALAAELGGKPEKDKPSLDLRKMVDDLRNSMGVVGTYFEAQHQEFRGKVKAFDETTD